MPSKTQINNTARQVLFRGDTRHPQIIFQQGFTAHLPDRKDQTLYDYVMTNGHGPYVSTSESEWAPISFVRANGWIYKIRTSTARVTVLEQLEPNRYGHQMEVAVFRSIPPEDIESAFQVTRGANAAITRGPLIANPSFRPG